MNPETIKVLGFIFLTTIMRDDTANHNWKMIPKQNFETEEAAVAFIQAVLGGAAA